MKITRRELFALAVATPAVAAIPWQQASDNASTYPATRPPIDECPRSSPPVSKVAETSLSWAWSLDIRDSLWIHERDEIRTGCFFLGPHRDLHHMCILRPGDYWSLDSPDFYPMIHIAQEPRSALIVARGKPDEEILLNYEFTTTSNLWVWRSMRLFIGDGFETTHVSVARPSPFGRMSSSFQPTKS